MTIHLVTFVLTVIAPTLSQARVHTPDPYYPRAFEKAEVEVAPKTEAFTSQAAAYFWQEKRAERDKGPSLKDAS